MNILIINQNAGSIKHGMELRPYYFAREWVKAGHDVTIVAASYSHYRNMNVQCNKVKEEYIDNIRYLWLPTPIYNENGGERYANMQAFLKELGVIKQVLIDLRPNIVISSSVFPIDAYVCYEIAKGAAAKFVVSVHDVWELESENFADKCACNENMHRAELFRCSQADTIITALPNFKEYLRLYGLNELSVWHIPNGVNLDEYKEFVELVPSMANELQVLHNEGKFLIGYAGTLDKDKALNVLINAAKELQEQPVHFALLGKGAQKSNLQAQAAEYGLSNVSFYDAIPNNMVFAFLKYMDCLYAGWQKNDLYRFGMSNNKICEYMFSSKPIIHSITADNDLVKETDCGISIPAEDLMAIVTAVKKMLSFTDSERAAMGHKGRDYVTRQLNYRSLAEWYLQVCRVM